MADAILKHMLNDCRFSALDRAFQALSDPIRRGMLARLSRGPASVSELARAAADQPARRAPASPGAGGERADRHAAKPAACAPAGSSPAALSAAERWIAAQRAVWEGRLDRFETYVDELQDARRMTGERQQTDLKLERVLDAPRELRVEGVDRPRAHQALVGAAALPDAGSRDRPQARRQLLYADDRPRRLRLQRAPACILEVVAGDADRLDQRARAGYRPNEFAADGCGGFPFTAIHTFEDAGDGKTRYTATVMHRNAADAEAHAAMGFHDGWGTCADQMAEVARSLG